MGFLEKIDTLKKKKKGLLKKSFESRQPREYNRSLETDDVSMHLAMVRPPQVKSDKASPGKPSKDKPEDLHKAGAAGLTVPEADLSMGASDSKNDEQPQSIDYIREKLGELDRGIDTPVRLFQIVWQFAKFKRGILIVSDIKDTALVPCAYHGIDEKRIESFSLSDNDIRSIFPANPEEKIALMEKDSLGKIGDLLYWDAADQNERTLIIPFVHLEKIIGLLVTLGMDQSIFRDMEDFLIENTKRTLMSRIQTLNQLRLEDLLSPDNAEETIAEIRKTAGTEGDTTHMYKFSIDAPVEGIMEENPFINPRWLRQELASLLGYVVSRTGFVFISGNAEIYLLIKASEQVDPDLLSHQAGPALNYFFHASGASLVPRVEEQTTQEIRKNP